jgi:hypothetical protein
MVINQFDVAPQPLIVRNGNLQLYLGISGRWQMYIM